MPACFSIVSSGSKAGDLAMYALIIIIGMVPPASSSAVGVTSQVVGKFENMDQCKAAASQPLAGGSVTDLNLSKQIDWYCVYMGTK